MAFEQKVPLLGHAIVCGIELSVVFLFASAPSRPDGTYIDVTGEVQAGSLMIATIFARTTSTPRS